MIVLTGAILLVGLTATTIANTNTFNTAKAQIPAGTEQVGNFVGKISTFLGKDILVIIATPNGNGLTNASSVVLGNESGKPSPIGNETVVVAPINASKGNESGGIAIVPITNGSTTVITTNDNGTHASTVPTTNVTETHNGTIVVTPEPEPKPPVVTPPATGTQTTCTCHIANGTLTAKPAPVNPAEHLPPQPVQQQPATENSAVPPPIGK